jgi:hypothetical protein
MYTFLQNSLSKNINAVESQLHGLQCSITSWTEIKPVKQILVKTVWPVSSKSVSCFQRWNVWMGSRGADMVHCMQRTTRTTLKYVTGCNVTVRQRPQRCRIWEPGSEAQALLPQHVYNNVIRPIKVTVLFAFLYKILHPLCNWPRI